MPACRLGVAIGIIARFAVRHDLAEDEIHQAAGMRSGSASSSEIVQAETVGPMPMSPEVVKYLSTLFPCGAIAPPAVERADGSTGLK